MRTYGIVIFTVWSLAILVSIIVVLFYEYNSFIVLDVISLEFSIHRLYM